MHPWWYASALRSFISVNMYDFVQFKLLSFFCAFFSFLFILRAFYFGCVFSFSICYEEIENEMANMSSACMFAQTDGTKYQFEVTYMKNKEENKCSRKICATALAAM